MHSIEAGLYTNCRRKRVQKHDTSAAARARYWLKNRIEASLDMTCYVKKRVQKYDGGLHPPGRDRYLSLMIKLTPKSTRILGTSPPF